MLEIVEIIGKILATLFFTLVCCGLLLPVLFLGIKTVFFDLKKSIYQSKIAKKNWEEFCQSSNPNSDLYKAKMNIIDLKKQLKTQTDELTAYRENIPKIEQENNNLTMQNRLLTQQDKDRSELLDRIAEKNIEIQAKIDSLIAENEALHNENEQLNKKLSSTKKGKKSKTVFWSDEQKIFFTPERLKAVFEEQIPERFSTPIIKEENSLDYVSVTIRPSEKEKARARRKGQSIPADYKTTLRTCSCDDFTYNLHGNSPCKHIFALALCVGIISPTGEFINTNPKIPESEDK